MYVCLYEYICCVIPLCARCEVRHLPQPGTPTSTIAITIRAAALLTHKYEYIPYVHMYICLYVLHLIFLFLLLFLFNVLSFRFMLFCFVLISVLPSLYAVCTNEQTHGQLDGRSDRRAVAATSEVIATIIV